MEAAPRGECDATKTAYFLVDFLTFLIQFLLFVFLFLRRTSVSIYKITL